MFLSVIFLLVLVGMVSASCGNNGCCNCTTYTVNGTFIDTYDNVTNRTLHIWTDGNFTKTDCVGGTDSHLLEILIGIALLIAFFLFLYVKLDTTHTILKNLVLLIAIYLVLYIPSTLVNLTSNTAVANLLKYYLLFLKIFSFYLLGYFIWSIADYYGKTATAKQFFKDNFGNKGGR